MEPTKAPDNLGYIIIILFLVLITISGIYAYKSIDFGVLDRLEKQPLNIPAPPSTNSASPSTNSSNIKVSTESAK